MSLLRGLFEPRSVAILGAAENQARFGGRVLRNIVEGGFTGEIYPVNPKYETVFGLKCYRSLREVPGEIDTAIFAISAQLIIPAIEECGRKGVKLAVVLSSGFAELGPEGAGLQEELVLAARRAGVRVLGPNGLGFLNVEKGIVATSSGLLPLGQMLSGQVSLVSQSGALGFPSIFSRAYDHGVGFRFVIAGGNEADITSADIIGYYAADPETRVIAAMVEGIKDPNGFREALLAADSAGKPVVILKVGRSEEGRKAAASHTASMAGSDAVNDAIFERYGVIRVDDLDELWEVPAVLASVPLPKGRRVAFLSSSGGLGGLFADQVRSQGLELATFSDETLNELRKLLPEYAVIGNPLDITGMFAGGPDESLAFRRFIELLTSDPRVDIVVVAQIVVREEVAAAVIEAVKSAQKTTVLLSIGGSSAAAGLRPFTRSGVHVFERPLTCATTLRHLCDRAESLLRRDDHVQSGPTKSRVAVPPGVVDHESSVELLEGYGLPFVRQILADNLDGALAAAESIGFPVVAKAILAGTIHKTEFGGVILDIRDSQAMRSAVEVLMRRVPGARILIQEMVPPGVEMIVGVQRDPQFGPVVLIGAGGTLVELLDDKVIAVPPFTRGYVDWRIRHLKAHRLLTGVRGSEPADIRGFVDLVVRVADLAVDQATTVESLDLNPVIVLPEGQGCRVVDWTLVGREAQA